MSIVKSLAVGEGDMYYIEHGSDNFTIIDCCMSEDQRAAIIEEIQSESRGKGITRFISTHPDEDHIYGLADLDAAIGILNFYCVKNEATKPDETVDFLKYCQLRDDSKKAFYIKRGCSRKWMNVTDDERGSSGINMLWPDVDSEHFKSALDDAKAGKSANNISCIVKYSLNDGVTVLWMGDLETDFMDRVQDGVKLDAADILFAPHHGRQTGRVPAKWIGEIDPKIVVLGEAPSADLDYYKGYNTITQNSAGEVTFLCEEGETHIYVSKQTYSVSFLEDEGKPNTYGKYIGTLKA